MCGRFTLTTPTDEISAYFRILEGVEGSARGRLRPRYNIAPTQPVACVRQTVDGDTERATPGGPPARCGPPASNAPTARELVDMRWGLIPHWAKDAAIGNRMINARSESVADKPAYREAFRKHRCLVVADGFYEWKRLDGAKQPYFICMEDRRPFAFAGLWARWKPRPGQLDKIVAPGKPEVPLSADGRVESCAFLTVRPNELMEPIHDRMPVILPPEHWDAWLDPDVQDAGELSSLLLPYPADEMRAHPVSMHVNKPSNNDLACIEPLKRLKIVRPEPDDEAAPPAPAQDSLF